MPLVTDQLKARGVPFEILFHKPTFHARDEAVRLGVPIAEVVKTILIDTPGEFSLAVIPASRRLDLHLVRRAIDPHARLASEGEVIERFPNYELGALPPMATLLDIPVLIDPEVVSRDTIVFATSECESIRVKTDQLLASEAFRIVPLIEWPVPRSLVGVAEEVELRASTEADEEILLWPDPVL